MSYASQPARCLPSLLLVQTKPVNKVDKKHLYIQLRASPVAALGVILKNGIDVNTTCSNMKIQAERTCIFVSVFRRNHWGMGLKE
jgi:hypothetical protein